MKDGIGSRLAIFCPLFFSARSVLFPLPRPAREFARMVVVSHFPPPCHRNVGILKDGSPVIRPLTNASPAHGPPHVLHHTPPRPSRFSFSPDSHTFITSIDIPLYRIIRGIVPSFLLSTVPVFCVHAQSSISARLNSSPLLPWSPFSFFLPSPAWALLFHLTRCSSKSRDWRRHSPDLTSQVCSSYFSSPASLDS